MRSDVCINCSFYDETKATVVFRCCQIISRDIFHLKRIVQNNLFLHLMCGCTCSLHFSAQGLPFLGETLPRLTNSSFIRTILLFQHLCLIYGTFFANCLACINPIFISVLTFPLKKVWLLSLVTEIYSPLGFLHMSQIVPNQSLCCSTKHCLSCYTPR